MDINNDTDLRILLEEEAARINNPTFIESDPVQFPRRFEQLQDIETSALLCASIAWGNRKMICRDCDRMLALMDGQPYRYVMDEGYEDLPDMNIHRTFFTANLKHYLRGLRQVFKSYGSICDFARAINIKNEALPAWALVDGLNRILADANHGEKDSRCLPQNLQTTALKRVNMALRWLVRNDGIVDMGVWDVISPAQLFIPLDVHVGDTARNLGLISRKANDKRTTVELTETLKRWRPDDPVWFDFALFGIGMGI